jgi:tetratricopeptide (TPR) repeat protein
VTCALAALVAGLGVIQSASYALNGDAAAPGTLPTRVPLPFGLAVYHLLDRIAPAPYVESTLATHALRDGDTGAAERYALRLPASPIRDDLLAAIAQARGEQMLAFEYFLAAPDVDAVQRAADALGLRDPAAAYTLEGLLRVRLSLLQTHPDAVAEAYWHMGELANRVARRQVLGSIAQKEWFHRGFQDFESAVTLAPLSEKYVLAAANQADLLGYRNRATALFAHGVDVDPASADAIAGLGVMAYERGDLAQARAYLTRARAIDGSAAMVRALMRDFGQGTM